MWQSENCIFCLFFSESNVPVFYCNAMLNSVETREQLELDNSSSRAVTLAICYFTDLKISF